MNKILVAGIGTGVGKTVVSAILTILLKGDYWKPVQCGDENDSEQLKNWIDPKDHMVYPPAYAFKAPKSPHQAARLENISMDLDQITLPNTSRPLIIEGVGGIFVPLTMQVLSIELFKKWNCMWVIVSKHYLGSINHTLLTIEGLKLHCIPILGIIFNGSPNPDSEASILGISQLPFLGRLHPEPALNQLTIHKYAKLWKAPFLKLLP